MATSPEKDRANSPQEEEKRFSGISPERWQELLRHYAEIQRYQKENDLEDKGDPPKDDFMKQGSS